MASGEVFQFDEFTLDVQERRLLRGAEAVGFATDASRTVVIAGLREFKHGPCELLSFTSHSFSFDLQHKTLQTEPDVVVTPAASSRDDRAR
jgi:hypothetical protein